jgi:hypothetical protein
MDKGKQMRSALISFFVVAIMAWVGDAHAARAYSFNDVYFNEQGEVVGQDMIGCSNFHWRGGDVNAPYHLTVEVNCDGSQRECSSFQGIPFTCGTDWSKTIQYSLYPGTAPFSLQHACDVSEGSCENVEPSPFLFQDFEVVRVRGN